NAKDNLVAAFSFTERQAEAIVTLQLYRLTNTDIVELETEHDELEYTVNQLREILSNEKKLLAIVKGELREIRKKYSTPRMSVIEDEIESIELEKEVLIPKEDVIVSVTKDGYIKRTNMRSFNASALGEFGMKEDDSIIMARATHTLEQCLVCTIHGKYMIIPVHELSNIKWKDHGQHLSSRFNIQSDEQPIAAFLIGSFDENRTVMTATKNGQ